ncbi:Apc15p protein-domain-containing protein [Amylocarpus encephaloides]|uniref:Apc15p protein-domain-containing protein n=1 Tax=Amylocarpus encephaloides TaxID=45428 RepID=A0A9P8C813_9HELO|nr:Apc15p protein-domain-containing protein [Amylocarpus encephaloides]
MLSLPSLAPQDSYTLWYTSSDPTSSDPASSDFPNTPHHHEPGPDPLSQGQNAQAHAHTRQHSNTRHPLLRLRLDEEYVERRKQNIQNYGNSWIKPPGIPKSLYQLREEKREMEEHQEALRREALAAELAEAEQEGLEAGMPEIEGEMEEARDLDDDVPEADETAMAFEDTDDSDEDGGNEDDIEEVPRGVLASRIPDDVYREALVRGEEARVSRFGEEGDSTIDGEDHEQMLEEEDLVHENGGLPADGDMDMDADLDADIPEADERYEHTDTDDDLTSSDDESVDGGALQVRVQAASSMIRSDGTQNSMDLSNVLSNSSSQLGSSPRQASARRLRRVG